MQTWGRMQHYLHDNLLHGKAVATDPSALLPKPDLPKQVRHSTHSTSHLAHTLLIKPTQLIIRGSNPQEDTWVPQNRGYSRLPLTKRKATKTVGLHFCWQFMIVTPKREPCPTDPTPTQQLYRCTREACRATPGHTSFRFYKAGRTRHVSIQRDNHATKTEDQSRCKPPMQYQTHQCAVQKYKKVLLQLQQDHHDPITKNSNETHFVGKNQCELRVT